MKAKNNIENCNFTGIHWDSKAVETIQTVAQGLLNLTELFKSQNIKIETLLNIEDCVCKSEGSKNEKK